MSFIKRKICDDRTGIHRHPRQMENLKKRSRIEQWWDRFVYGTPYDEKTEKKTVSYYPIVDGKRIKRTTEFVPRMLPFGGSYYRERLHYKDDYSSSEWEKIEHKPY